jgi:hypothetical protein
MVLTYSVLQSLHQLSSVDFDTHSHELVFDRPRKRGISHTQLGLIMQDIVGTVPFTVIHQTAILGAIEFICYWLVSACPSAPVTLHHSVAIEGTTYSAASIDMNIYPDYWTIPLVYTTVVVDIATTYHTAAIVCVPNYVQND